MAEGKAGVMLRGAPSSSKAGGTGGCRDPTNRAPLYHGGTADV